MSENGTARKCMTFVAAVVLFITVAVGVGVTAAELGRQGSPKSNTYAGLRTWTDDTGEHKLEAELVEVQDGKVRLRTADGGLKVVPLERLSAADQEYVKQQRSQGQPTSANPLAATEFAWLSEERIPNERVSQALNDVWKLSPEAAEVKTPLVQSTAGAASSQGRAVGALLVAAAQERAGKREAATGAYRQLAGDGKGTPYGASASFRLPLLDSKGGEDAVYQTLARQPPEDGWYLTPVDGWHWDDSRKVALNELLRIRSDGISVRLFEWLRGYSPFPKPYAYMFILLAIGIGSTILTLPWHIKLAGAGERIRALAPQVESLKQMYGSDPANYFKEVGALYQRHGVNSAAGCLVGIVQMAFTIWVLLAVRTYWPRMSLDGSQFLWVSDITQFDVWVMVLMAAAGIVVPFLTGQMKVLTGQMKGTGVPAATAVIGPIVLFAIIGAIAWYWQWPAYVLVFFLLQQIVGTSTQLTLAAARRLAG